MQESSMSSRFKRDPSYRLHRQSGQGIVTLTDAVTGQRRDFMLGQYGTRASRAEYSRLVAEWHANDRRLVTNTDPIADLTILELLAAFWPWAEKHYRRPDGTNTNELNDYRLSLRPVAHLYGTLTAADFSPLKLKAVRQLMIDGYEHPKYGAQEALARTVINRRVGRIVRLFKWAVGEELVSAPVHQALKAVTGLQQGRCDARETDPVKPVPDARVEAVLPFLLPPVRAMVQVQRLTGMRPGEVCLMRGIDIDTSGAVWLYKPPYHKLAYRGKPRVIAVGPRAQALIKPFLQLDTQAYLFSPRAAVAHREQVLRANRRSKVQPSQVCRKVGGPRRCAGERYTSGSYLVAVYRACDRAFLPPAPLAKRADETSEQWKRRLSAEQQAELQRWVKDHRWHVNQLRHSHATDVRRQFGLEAAQVSLGHSQAAITELYAERDVGLAVQVAGKIG
jgi:integrase